ncbi:hypothetical protein COW36_20280 [bacterium (Candidatus Blackallbacteria) CG17_big_fil_post_rev_8_21_14_2_50_48_46]|uniref:Uncharacterized protein n=1 Tax=bacterium (Candidatus Blackallbacteria) CG17_big_fil_post_rev_8_21_14_2_50_48_46 TaxID=2014261 RepID=A0A2M7FZC1_9BACT|nr:MAG: hypothetical protein COW64_22605 [bacterium (Candidatus Blackallbacteria) CG18_big_fil_WC_8_21_14_2_50_49_26]PIW14744.1 MAG: hypothetical protein COW36_20280 [bacterium (Candidatus Blackallbacteria) CG17_big_fil_post_rev_8_21_14_2_50_48_46]PIW50846.1 MAG: hypothetical protein COW20_01095 [bacterium (Candidatus Blackallbacteria) CG13_big_fil_rev_8_21_14_2_50_49_14]
MKTEFSEQEQRDIRQAKAMLRHFWQQSKLKPAQILEALAERGLMVKNSTLSTWLSLKEGNTIRPKQEAVMPLLEIFLPQKSQPHRQELWVELSGLLGFQEKAISSEEIRNRLSEQMDETLKQTLHENQVDLEVHLKALEVLWEEIEPAILEYDKGFPVIRVEKDNLSLLRKLAGHDKQVQKSFESAGGYEIPLSRVQSLHALAEIINLLNEGSRVLHAMIERNLVDEGYLTLQLSRVEEMVSYIWEISDRLLNNNLLCKTVPQLKKALIRVMSITGGIRFLLHNQTEQSSEILLEKTLASKNSASEAELKCAVAVFMGILARQGLQQKDQTKLSSALNRFEKAQATLKRYLEKIESEQESFYYKKELANLCYDIAALLLWRIETREIKLDQVQKILETAAQSYQEVLELPNLFVLGLTEQRALHIRAFYMISSCWTCSLPQKGIREINQLCTGETLNERFWFVQIAKTIAWSVLWYRFERDEGKTQYKASAEQELKRAMLVPGFEKATGQETQTDWVLSQAFAQVAVS